MIHHLLYSSSLSHKERHLACRDLQRVFRGKKVVNYEQCNHVNCKHHLFEKRELIERIRNSVVNRSEKMTHAITSSSLSSTKNAFLYQRLMLSLSSSRL